MEDTICAISTALGVGGISIIRVSGSSAIELVNKIFKGKDLKSVPSHTINYGYLIYEDEIIDEVLVSIMKAPKTYTREDIVEINLHGSIATTQKVMEILISIGCKQAEPGEFTKRAFLNGRIDLTQAEAVSDLIEAESENARKLSVNHLTGELSNTIKKIKSMIIALQARIEVNIDYPEYEDIEDMEKDNITPELDSILKELDILIKNSANGKIIKNGINVAIIGKPNVGKSSILNKLIGENKAIVTDIKGTTRDIVEGKVTLEGTLINFIDTAGIHDTNDEVEKIGVEKSKEKLEDADLVILVLNGNEELTDEDNDLIETVKEKNHIIFVNKSDLELKLDTKRLEKFIRGNVKEDNGLNELKGEIISYFSLDKIKSNNFNYVSNARELALIKKSYTSIENAKTACLNNFSSDLIAIDLEEARRDLSEVLGEVYSDELIDELFSKFCLGK